jgi:flavorubredoxin
MHARQIRDGIDAIVTVHWERRLFDSLIPLPDGTSYNAYLIKGRNGYSPDRQHRPGIAR